MSQIRYFRALCDELNFTRAAERCNVSQPSLTRAIRLLEEEFGGPLFHRERMNTHLSELGRIVKPHLDQIFEQTNLVAKHAREFASLQRTKLTVGIMCTIAPAGLVELVSGVQTGHPSVQLEIVDSTAGDLDKLLITGDLEVAIYCMPERERDERLHYLPLFREQIMIVLSPMHRLANQEAIRVVDLKDESYLERVNCEFGALGDQVFGDLGVTGETVCRSERDDWVLAMAASGLGYAFMPRQLINHPDVVARPLVEPEFWREVSLVTVRGRPHSPAVGALIHEAMRMRWLGRRALAVERMAESEGR